MALDMKVKSLQMIEHKGTSLEYFSVRPRATSLLAYRGNTTYPERVGNGKQYRKEKTKQMWSKPRLNTSGRSSKDPVCALKQNKVIQNQEV